MFDLDEAISVLETTPATLRALLSGVGGSWLRVNEGGDSWNAVQILGHLLHGEKTDWIPRARTILESGETEPFEPFDRFAQDRLYSHISVPELVEAFAEARAANLRTLRSWKLQDEVLERTGLHPAFGRVTLRQLLSTWVAHDLGHIAQITRVMANRYREEVGPWADYLPILAPRGND